MLEVTIRPAIKADIPEIMLLLREFHSEMPMLPLSDLKVLDRISDLLEKGVILLAINDSKIIGSIGVGPQQWWFSDEWILTDYWTYVRKGYRKSRAARKLLLAVKEFSEHVELPLLMGIFTFDQATRKNTLYRRYLDPVGETFVSGLEFAGVTNHVR